MVRRIANIHAIDFTSTSDGYIHQRMNDQVFERFCLRIMPRIRLSVETIVLDHWSMERVLLACKYPILQTIVFSCFQSDLILNCLKDGSPIVHLFKTQIKSIHVASTKSETNTELFTDAVARIFELCTNLTELNISRIQSKLLIFNRPPNTFLSSNVSVLSVMLTNFNDCLCLLDGRLDQLLSFSVKIDSIDITPSVIDNTKQLPHLLVFSIISDHADGYEQQVLPLLRRMPNLKELTLCLTIKRLTFIDGIHLNEEILRHLSQLTKFIFHIRTLIKILNSHHRLSANDIRNTFNDWKYGEVNCHVDYLSDVAGQCHIYSVPFKMNSINCVTNSFFGNSFPFVVYIRLYDVHSFEYIYFKWIARGFPLLKYLFINNMTPPEHKHEFDTMNNNKNSIISFPQLILISLEDAHIDYVELFLNHTKSYLPCFSTLVINYDKLVTVTNNFTNDSTRVNCAQLKMLNVGEHILYPEHFYLYFPYLEK